MLEYILKGSWLMIPLVACSVVALAAIIDRAWAFHANSKVDTRSLRAKVLDLLHEGRVDDAALVCANTPGPVSAVLLAGIQSYAKHKDIKNRVESITTVVEKAMEDYSQHAMSAVEKRFSVLSTVGNAAPLLGMTGTVTGMIGSFAAMREMGADAAGVAGGISEALITTATGLLIALGAVIPYHIFSGMSDRVELEIEEASSELLDFVTTSAAGGNSE